MCLNVLEMFDKYQIIIIILIANQIFARKLARVDRMVMCDKSTDCALRINEIRIRNPEGENAIVSLNCTMLRELREEIKLEVLVTRCLNKESLDTCVPFTTLRPLNTCGLISMSNMAWSDFVNSVEPHLACPFQKGEYILRNGTFDANKFAFFPIDNFYWRARVTIYEGKEFITVCADLRAIKVLD